MYMEDNNLTIMKKGSIHIYVILALLIFSMSLGVLGCHYKNNVDKIDVKEAFLNIYFTTNYDDRYDKWIKFVNDNSQSIDREQAIADAIDHYYDPVKDYVSDEFYNTMILNRDIIKYDRLAYENGFSIVPNNYEFAEYSEADDTITYTFTAHLTKQTDNDLEEGVIDGQITVSQIGEELLISNLYLSKLGFVPDNP